MNSPNLTAAVERQLTDTPATARMIWERVDCYSLQTVRRVLGDLADEGKAVKTSEPYYGRERFKYRKAA